MDGGGSPGQAVMALGVKSVDVRKLLVDALDGSDMARRRLFEYLFGELLTAPETQVTDEYMAYAGRVLSDACQLLIDPDAFLLGRGTDCCAIEFDISVDEMLTRRCVMRVMMSAPLTDQDITMLQARYDEELVAAVAAQPNGHHC